MKLLYTPTSPYSRKVRVVAAELEIPLALEVSDPHDPRSAVARLNPLGKVPTVGVIAAACALGYLDLRLDDLGWREAEPDLATWFAGFSQRPSMQATRHPAP